MLLEFLDDLSQECAAGIEAVALDMAYFKLKIFQLYTEDTPSFLYNRVPSARLSTVGKP